MMKMSMIMKLIHGDDDFKDGDDDDDNDGHDDK